MKINFFVPTDGIVQLLFMQDLYQLHNTDKKINTKNSNWALSTKKQDFDNMKLSFCALLKRVLRKKNLKVPNKKQYNTTGKKASQRH